MALRRIIEEIKVANSKASVVFVNLSKAFDSTNRSAMLLHILCLYDLPDKIIACIKTMYGNPEIFVLSPDRNTDSSFTTTGILQGDTVAPYLFIIVVDNILCISLDPIYNHGFALYERSTRHPSKHITDLDYADDIALISDQVNNAEILLQSLETVKHKVGVTLNITKTECMLLNMFLRSYIRDSKHS